jgi:hypothetical protein
MNASTDRETRFGIAALVALNLVPIYGVLVWGWKSFDLIFLYWLENVIIGVFTIGRFLARPYGHAIDLAFPLVVAPFFALHYGGFTWGHGTLVLGLFAPDNAYSDVLVDATWEVISQRALLPALISLVAIQVMDWVRDVRRHGFGADGIIDLMIKPYRRVVVLHVAILTAGFALAALDEPLTGLIILVALKTTSDIWHWRKEKQFEHRSQAIVLSPAQLAEMEEQYQKPVITVNGKELEFESFAAMKASREFRFALALMKMIGLKDSKILTTFINMKIERERSLGTTTLVD